MSTSTAPTCQVDKFLRSYDGEDRITGQNMIYGKRFLIKRRRIQLFFLYQNSFLWVMPVLLSRHFSSSNISIFSEVGGINKNPNLDFCSNRSAIRKFDRITGYIRIYGKSFLVKRRIFLSIFSFFTQMLLPVRLARPVILSSPQKDPSP